MRKSKAPFGIAVKRKSEKNHTGYLYTCTTSQKSYVTYLCEGMFYSFQVITYTTVQINPNYTG